MKITIEELNKYYGGYHALTDLNLEIASGELIALLGPSGSGKTTLLRTIAGLENFESGRIFFGEEETSAQPLGRRGIGFVFQHYALFKHMKVFDNVAFGLTCKPKGSRPSKEEISRKVHELLKLVQLEHYADRFPSELSGGQRQRVALARALAVEPRVLLLDEPFGALDAKVRKELRKWLRRLHDELHITSIFVTHDQEEALEVADRIVIMHKGRIEQTGTPEEVYEKPANSFVYSFLGNVNLFHGRLVNGSMQFENASVDESDKDLDVKDAALFVRPHDVQVLPADSPDGIEARVSFLRQRGSVVNIELYAEEGGGRYIDAEISKDAADLLELRLGLNVKLRFRNTKIYTKDEEAYSYVI
ncbi:sulfate/molybdate ABC transporter ATP-binding protein [Geovibrio ferrireducens]|jgi:sulfate transport system ATP-binding protein|uniref:sulfate/molybdate ABC transporter ATP-binding protein n=1 Tax=Geovibrio ferrireducens TaxID=46201 RepID=UPI0022478777|nr:sulfate ABC transporter ATP-binding protein [Geovibrio ferrireducens]